MSAQANHTSFILGLCCVFRGLFVALRAPHTLLSCFVCPGAVYKYIKGNLYSEVYKADYVSVGMFLEFVGLSRSIAETASVFVELSLRGFFFPLPDGLGLM